MSELCFKYYLLRHREKKTLNTFSSQQFSNNTEVCRSTKASLSPIPFPPLDSGRHCRLCPSVSFLGAFVDFDVFLENKIYSFSINGAML